MKSALHQTIAHAQPLPAIGTIHLIPISMLHPMPCSPFKILDDDAMQELVLSIKNFGILNPLEVRPYDSGNFEIISGARRYQGAIQNQLDAKPLLQFLTVARVVLLNRVKFSIARRILRRDQKNADEKRIMDLARQTLLSTAEIIRCIEMDVTNLPNSDSIMKTIYNDRETTSDNIGDLVKTAPCTREVLFAVANLYLRKQLIFDRV